MKPLLAFVILLWSSSIAPAAGMDLSGALTIQSTMERTSDLLHAPFSHDGSCDDGSSDCSNCDVHHDMQNAAAASIAGDIFSKMIFCEPGSAILIRNNHAVFRPPVML